MPAHQPAGQPGVLLQPGHSPPVSGQPCGQHRQGPGQRAGGEGAGGAAVVWQEVLGSELATAGDSSADHCIAHHVQPYM